MPPSGIKKQAGLARHLTVIVSPGSYHTAFARQAATAAGFLSAGVMMLASAPLYLAGC
jgi:hypothetical protein